MAKRLAKKKKPRAGSKAVKRDIKSLKKGLRKEIALTRNVKKSTTMQGKELSLLKKELEKLKKRRKRAALSEYNRFMRQQIKAGKTFKQAVRLWNQRKRALLKKGKKRSAYNIFISMQLKQGKTMKQAIAAWNRLKNPKKKRGRPAKKKPKPRRGPARAAIAKPKTKALKKPAGKKPVKRKPIKKKPKKRAVGKKPKPKRRPVKRKLKRKMPKRKRPVKRKPKRKTVRKRPARRIAQRAPAVVAGNVFPGQEIARAIEDTLKKISTSSETVSTVKKSISAGQASESSDEAIALRMLDVYFTEIARYGLKRRLTLDEVINAYFYALLRVERKGIELNEIKKAILREGL
ncbi:MAG: hypothetical protein JW744_00690 [Candidatus Diapherotrites archaeon]|uniref:Uncharacterized protein n=1 Tax=Candidatus Iainarchaeum sp. TaxID=3101447 RepID=A0A938YML7_9ARCH|nr:hypothetical protein [Candidatus Diapherotrites archaeon]